MAMDAMIRRNLSGATVALNGHLRGVVDFAETAATSTSGEVGWRFEDEPNAEPQSLGPAVVDREVAIPLDLQGRPIRLYLISRNETGSGGVQRWADAVQTVFVPSMVPVLESAVFDAVDTVTLTIAANGGIGNIHILRAIGAGEFSEITSVAFGVTTYNDVLTLDGTYSYKLMQDGVTGDSNIIAVVVDVAGGGGGGGSPPTNLAGSWDGDSVPLTWTNNGGSGLNNIERKDGVGGTFASLGTVASGTAAYDDAVEQDVINHTYYYRVSNASVAGYSNSLGVFVPRTTL